MDRLTSLLLSPFWLIGRLFNAFGVAGLWIWQAFLDGLGWSSSGTKGDTLDAVILIWLAALTVWMIL